MQSFRGKINLFLNPLEYRIRSEYGGKDTLSMVILCRVQRTFSKQTKKSPKKKVSMMAFCCQLLLLLRPPAAVLLSLLLLLEQRQQWWSWCDGLWRRQW
jgi:hypothetical protein